MPKCKISKICIPANGSFFVLERTPPRLMRWTNAPANIRLYVYVNKERMHAFSPALYLRKFKYLMSKERCAKCKHVARTGELDNAVR